MTKQLKVGDLIRLTDDLEHGIRDSSESRRVVVRKGSIGKVIHVRTLGETYRIRMLRFHKGSREWRPTAVTTYVCFAGTGDYGQKLNQWEEVNVLDMLAVIAPDKPGPKRKSRKTNRGPLEASKK